MYATKLSVTACLTQVIAGKYNSKFNKKENRLFYVKSERTNSKIKFHIGLDFEYGSSNAKCQYIRLIFFQYWISWLLMNKIYFENDKDVAILHTVQ